MMYIKFILLQLLMGIAYLLNWVFHPFSYLFRKSITKNPGLWKWLILYWFSDSYEQWSENPEINYINNWYGVYEIYDGDYEKFKTLNWWQKYKLAFQWGVLRNPNWNLQVAFQPKQGEKYNIKEKTLIGDADIWTWRNREIWGKQFVTWKTDRTKYFRYSYTRDLKKWSPFKLLGYKHVNFMAGAEHRFVYKYRVFK